MVLVALTLRVALILGFRYYDFSTLNSLFAYLPFVPPAIAHFPFGFGFETGAVAYSLATGHGFASPFAGSTGPTAWLAPLYPALCALVFKIFGCFTLASGFVLLFINSVFAALNCIPIVRIGEAMGSRKAGLWAGWLWAGGVFFMRWPSTWVWEVSLSALLVSVLFLQSLRLARDSSAKAWALFGLVWGIAGLTNPALLAFLPAAGLYPAFRLWRNRQSWLRPAAVAALIFATCLAPWLIRNRVVFHQWIFIRGNAPFEFTLGNYHGSNALGWFGRHPTQNKFEWARYARMGEVAYIAEKKQIAGKFLKQYPLEFLQLCATRVVAFWTGDSITTEPYFQHFFFEPLSALMLLGLIAALATHVEGAWLFFWLMLSYPITYYVIFAQPRYRHAIEPEMLLLSTYFVYGAIRDISARFSARAGNAALPSTDAQPQPEFSGELVVR
jgi:hypothetical protein